MIESLKPFFLLVGTVIGIGAFLCGTHWFLIGRHSGLGNERKFARQVILLGLTVVGILTVILMLPISDSSRNNLLGLFGILISGILAFSSTSIFGNLASGVLLRITKPFKTGDFIQIGDHFGRVSERGLFDTEIQTETRELVALPNTYCISNPVKTIRRSGTIISASLSLGYDIDHNKIETLLVSAAREADLEDPFVHIVKLEDFTVAYRVSGLLPEPKFLISARSRLYRSVLDTLHQEDIEIMSPAYMNQRKLSANHRAIPTAATSPLEDKREKGLVETIAFDKAEQAGNLENERQKLVDEIQKSEVEKKQSSDENEKKIICDRIEQAQEDLKAIEKAKEVIKTEDVKIQHVSADPRPTSHDSEST